VLNAIVSFDRALVSRTTAALDCYTVRCSEPVRSIDKLEGKIVSFGSSKIILLVTDNVTGASQPIEMKL
jgi:hypothetical protein